jgi:hypothetical protein
MESHHEPALLFFSGFLLFFLFCSFASFLHCVCVCVDPSSLCVREFLFANRRNGPELILHPHQEDHQFCFLRSSHHRCVIVSFESHFFFSPLLRLFNFVFFFSFLER